MVVVQVAGGLLRASREQRCHRAVVGATHYRARVGCCGVHGACVAAKQEAGTWLGEGRTRAPLRACPAGVCGMRRIPGRPCYLCPCALPRFLLPRVWDGGANNAGVWCVRVRTCASKTRVGFSWPETGPGARAEKHRKFYIVLLCTMQRCAVWFYHPVLFVLNALPKCRFSSFPEVAWTPPVEVFDLGTTDTCVRETFYVASSR